MQSITIQGNETLINQIIEVSKALAKTSNETLKISDAYTDELNQRANLARQGKDVISEEEALIKFEKIKNGTYAN
ncbi:hypothetical protein [Campylobacter fetus]|uniref:hypothetical protein n=1 Tax=Campylobacter fetus TaxID=196 RepID=UPI000FCC16A8|nr:hypothetical protein [Campylobacter fetus]RUT48867.1 hypothetical protein BWK67_08995 [Campylobacter fetus]RUT48989.1 hypothetical protein BWK51_08970 [Campylobacter fetus]